MNTHAAHWYLSTACLHEQHEHCRLTCKYCNAACDCRCHHPDVVRMDVASRLPGEVSGFVELSDRAYDDG